MPDTCMRPKATMVSVTDMSDSWILTMMDESNFICYLKTQKISQHIILFVGRPDQANIESGVSGTEAPK